MKIPMPIVTVLTVLITTTASSMYSSPENAITFTSDELTALENVFKPTRYNLSSDPYSISNVITPGSQINVALLSFASSSQYQDSDTTARQACYPNIIRALEIISNSNS